MGRAGCPIMEQCCLIPAGAGDGISARNHAENSWEERAEEGCRSDCKHNAHSFGDRMDSIAVQVANIIDAGTGLPVF